MDGYDARERREVERVDRLLGEEPARSMAEAILRHEQLAPCVSDEEIAALRHDPLRLASCVLSPVPYGDGSYIEERATPLFTPRAAAQALEAAVGGGEMPRLYNVDATPDLGQGMFTCDLADTVTATEEDLREYFDACAVLEEQRAAGTEFEDWLRECRHFDLIRDTVPSVEDGKELIHAETEYLRGGASNAGRCGSRGEDWAHGEYER